jgi:hypothetical protein
MPKNQQKLKWVIDTDKLDQISRFFKGRPRRFSVIPPNNEN